MFKQIDRIIGFFDLNKCNKMEIFGRHLERQGQFSPADQETSFSPIQADTPTLPVRSAISEASSTPADVRPRESQHLQRLLRGELKAEAL